MDATSQSNPVETLLAAPEFCSLVMQAAPNGLAIIDAEGRILYVNQTMARLFGYTTEELMQMNVDQLVPERVRDRHAEYRRGFMAAPVARAMGAGRDLSGRRKDGAEFPIEIGLNPVRIGEQTCVLASIIDITVRKKAQQSAETHTRRMEALNDQLAAYTSAISHDLRAPLRAIRNYADFLIEDIGPGLDPKSKNYLDALHDAVREADQMILDLLKLGRITPRSAPASDVDIEELFNEIRRHVAHGKDVEFTMPASWPKIEAPRVLLVHIFHNLIANAVKFNTSSPKRVEIGWRPLADGHVEFYVKDNGIGIDPRYHDRIFDPFERLNNPEEYEGTGIGLSLVKKAVTVLDGRIRVESRPGRGSTFFVTLPQRSLTND